MRVWLKEDDAAIINVQEQLAQQVEDSKGLHLTPKAVILWSCEPDRAASSA